MEPIAAANPAPSKAQLIQVLTKPIARVIQSETNDDSDIDRVWLLRKFHKNYLYWRDLAYFAPALYQGLIDATGIDGSSAVDSSGQDGGVYDYTQNHYKGYGRKFMAVLGTRIPNAVAVPNDPSDELDIAAARAANNAALYIRQHCGLQIKILWMVFSIFNFGTSFWSIEWVVDGRKYGYRDVPQLDTENLDLPPDQSPDGALPASPTSVSVPKELPPTQVPKGSLVIRVTDGTEVSVPLDTDALEGTDGCYWINSEREMHKSYFLAKYNGENDTVNLRELLRDAGSSDENAFDDQSTAQQYGESVRSAMSSPIGVVRPKRENRWTENLKDWTPQMYEMIDDASIRQLLYENFPKGVRITTVKGRIVDLEDRNIHGHWQECYPDANKRIMGEPIGDDWVITQDILNNTLNQANETIERSNEPGFADPTRVDLEAYERRRSSPLDLIPALRPPGGTLADLIYRPAPPQFSEQIPQFRNQVEQASQQITGLLEIIWGGDQSDPTARQSELKTNAAIRQLSVVWVMIGKSLEGVYKKSCDLLAENEEGILSFSKQKANSFGKFDTVSVVTEDLRNGQYHFEADEAIPMTWGQQRDLLMWMLDKPAELLKSWGMDDPLNIYEFVTLLGMPGQHIPHMDARDKGMDVISRLLKAKPAPGQIDAQTGQPGPPQPSIAPDWEDDSAFMAKLAQAYLTVNFELKDENPDAYENVQLWGQAHDKKANVPPPKPPIKGSVAVTLKGEDLGNAAVSQALQDANITQPGTQAQQTPMPKPFDPNAPTMPAPGGPALGAAAPTISPVPTSPSAGLAATSRS